MRIPKLHGSGPTSSLGYFWLGLFLLSLWVSPVRAQVYDPSNPTPGTGNTINDLPDPMYVHTDWGSSLDVQTKVDNILRVRGGEIMSGLQDYQVELTDLLIDKLKDELVKMFADMMPIGSMAEKIISAYQKKKDENLAKAIDRVKVLSRNSLNKQLKTKYQDFKVNYARMNAKWKSLPELKNSVADHLSESEYDKLWGEHVVVMDGFKDEDTHSKLKWLYPEIDPNAPGNKVEHGWHAFVSDAVVMDDAKKYKELLKTISNKEYDNDAMEENEMVAYSHYDRMVMKRAILDRMRERVHNLQGINKKVNQHIQGSMRKDQRKQLTDALGGKDTYMPLPKK